MSGMAFASYVRVLFGWGPNNVSITDRFTYSPNANGAGRGRYGRVA